MDTLPQLIEDDIRVLDAALAEFLKQTDAIASLVIDKGGFLIAQHGDDAGLDFTTIGALASGAFMASQTIAGLVNEKNFNSTYQQGEKFSLFILDVDEHSLLVVIFPSSAGVGIVKYYASSAAGNIARQFVTARQRTPGPGLDLSELNAADPQVFFRKRA
jgi:predicted regulator of Ras-like GTPase activity (Roadblock/LC7/MglB family)